MTRRSGAILAMLVITVGFGVAGWLTGRQIREPDSDRDESSAPKRPPPRRAVRKLPVDAYARGIGPQSIYHPRAANEWQGMLVDISVSVSCESTSFCGLAASCRDGKCGPCVSDEHCLAGEACVLDHCVLASMVGCRSRVDCDPEHLCILTGYSAGPRGNDDLRAICSSESGGREQPLETEVRETVPDDPIPVRPDEMIRRLRA